MDARLTVSGQLLEESETQPHHLNARWKMTSHRRCKFCGHLRLSRCRTRTQPCRLRSSFCRQRPGYIQLHGGGAAQHARCKRGGRRWLYRKCRVGGWHRRKASHQHILRKQICCYRHHESSGRRRGCFGDQDQCGRPVSTHILFAVPEAADFRSFFHNVCTIPLLSRLTFHLRLVPPDLDILCFCWLFPSLHKPQERHY